MKRLIRLFAVALIAAMFVSFIYNRVTQDKTKKPKKPIDTVQTPADQKKPKVRVVTAEVNLEPYERPIEGPMVKMRRYPEHLLPRYAPLDIKDVLGKLPTEPIYRGEIISLARLVDKDEYKESLRRLIPPGHRALAVLVNNVSSVAGFVSQGDIVDLAAVYDYDLPGASKRGRKGRKDKMARIILQNIKVLIVGKKYNPVYKENPAGHIEGDLGAKPVTFAVTPRDAAVIHHVTQMGQSSFRILLKHSEDQDLVETEGYSIKRIEDHTREVLRSGSSTGGGKSDADANKPKVRRVERVIEVYKGLRKATDEHFTEIQVVKQ